MLRGRRRLGPARDTGGRFQTDRAIAIVVTWIDDSGRGGVFGKHRLFAGSYEGGDRAAVLYSVLASCRAAGAGPFEYLSDILSAPDRRLTPRAWMAARTSTAVPESR